MNELWKKREEDNFMQGVSIYKPSRKYGREMTSLFGSNINENAVGSDV